MDDVRHPNGITDSKVHGANMGPTWVLSAPDGPHVGPMNLAIRDNNGIRMSHGGFNEPSVSDIEYVYPQPSNIRRTLVGNKIVDH